MVAPLPTGLEQSQAMKGSSGDFTQLPEPENNEAAAAAAAAATIYKNAYTVRGPTVIRLDVCTYRLSTLAPTCVLTRLASMRLAIVSHTRITIFGYDEGDSNNSEVASNPAEADENYRADRASKMWDESDTV
ncbi:hypothetical protein F53441_14252 [Fusarium austroafricanum]|uniref:Uncharacterized protein n=1 Tax=Fusarium austroafricanum TaxID=2364996 RepID=A0A8H4JGE0_9HYPO|nr:hypothetical protein F53441_14252 [Fusarium austroafricanum]